MPVAYGPVEICKSRGVTNPCRSSHKGEPVVVVEEEEGEEGEDTRGNQGEFPKCTLCLSDNQVGVSCDYVDSNKHIHVHVHTRAYLSISL